MTLGAGTIAAERFGAASLVDPRPYTVGKLTETFKIYPKIGTLLRYGIWRTTIKRP